MVLSREASARMVRGPFRGYALFSGTAVGAGPCGDSACLGSNPPFSGRRHPRSFMLPSRFAVHDLLPDAGIDIPGDALFLFGGERRGGQLGEYFVEIKTSTSAFVCSFSQKRSSSANRALIEVNNSRLACFTRSRDVLSRPSFCSRSNNANSSSRSPSSGRALLLLVQAVHQFDEPPERFLDGRAILLAVVVRDDFLVLALIVHARRIARFDDRAEILARIDRRNPPRTRSGAAA